MPIDSKAIGAQIQRFRKALGFTQAALAEQARLDTAYVSQVERGFKTLSLDALGRLADALRVQPGALLDARCKTEASQLSKELEALLKRWPSKKRRSVVQALRLLAP